MSSHFEPARKCALLARMTDDELRDFLRFTEFKGIRQFFELVKQGEHGDSMFIVLTGEVRVRLMIAEKERILTTFPAGEFFGEMTLFDSTPRSCDIVANIDSTFLKLSADGLSRMMNEASEGAIAFLRALGETFLKRIQADNSRFHTALGQKFQIAHPPPGVRRIPSTPEIDRLLVKAADEPDSDLKPQLVDALGSRRLFAGWSRSDLQMLVAFGSYERQADPKTLQKWIARGDLQLILLGTYQTRPLPRDRHRVWWGWIGLEQWICDADTNTECHAEPGCAFFRIPAEGLERMRSLTPTLMAKFLWSIAQGLARRIRNDNKRFRDRLGRGWAPDDGDDDDDY